MFPTSPARRPTRTTFATNVGRLLEKEYRGLYNMVYDGVTSRLGVTHEVIRLLGLSEKIRAKQAAYEHCIRLFPESQRLPDSSPLNNTTTKSAAAHFGVKRLFFENVSRIAPNLKN